MIQSIAHYFEFSDRHTNYRQEMIAGITTFLTMVYIVIVNPAILSAAGLDPGASFVATCIVAGLGSILCGLLSNYPVALAPSMSINAYFAFSIVKSHQLDAKQALAAVSAAGIVFFILTLARLRHWILQAIPEYLGHAIGAGIGCFIGFIGLKTLGIIVGDPATLVKLGPVGSPTILLGLGGLCCMILLDYYKVPGAILLSILGSALLGHCLGIQTVSHMVAWPPHLLPTYHLTDFMGLAHSHHLMIILTFLLVALFDSTGTLLGLLHQAKLAHDPAIKARMSRAFYAESFVTALGGWLGTSATGPYIESATGIAAGGRTGLTGVVVGLLFFMTLWFAPLAAAIPAFSYAPALLFVAAKMCSHLQKIAWDEPLEAFPAIFVILLIPLSFSIVNGIALGFLLHVILQAFCGRIRTLPWSVWLLFLAFLIYFFLLGTAV